MAKSSPVGRDTSIKVYGSKRNFALTPEPSPRRAAARPGSVFVVQKHTAHRAGLHWDFRLEHGGVLWSWAVPKGPSLDPADKRMAIHVEDHPIDYADFEGTIPVGEYGAGKVETWDRGTWEPIGDPEEGIRRGELKFILTGQRLNGYFTLARLRQRDPGKQEAWLLIKGRDDEAREGAGARVLEQQPFSLPRNGRSARQKNGRPPAPGAVRGRPPADQSPQLCKISETPPGGNDWVSEIKFDGYRLLIWLDDGNVRLVTRNGHDWADRLPAVVKAVGQLKLRSALLDGELVALRQDGVSSFPDLQIALSSGRDDKLNFYVFDLLELNGWDLRACSLLDRKAVLETLTGWAGMLQFSSHVVANAHQMYQTACELGLEGIVCKQAEASYRSGRNNDWLKLKCVNQDEFIVLGWTPPSGRRRDIGALHIGYFDTKGNLHYAGGVGTGFSEHELASLRNSLDRLKAAPPDKLLVAGDPIDPSIQWVQPAMVIEVQFSGWSGAGRVRHSVYHRLREDKAPGEIVREVANPEAERSFFPPSGRKAMSPQQSNGAIPSHQRLAQPATAQRPVRAPPTSLPVRKRIVVAKSPKRPVVVIGNVEVSNPDRQLWPGITKRDLAEYWQLVAPYALPGLAKRPLAIVRCPDGVDGEHFFQKSGHGQMPQQIRDGSVSGSPYLAIDDVDGLIALTQMSAIELHPWGAREGDPTHPDWLVFDLDPGEDVAMCELVRSAHELRERLLRLGLSSFCRTTGGKGLHVVVPLVPDCDWGIAKSFSRALAELMSQEYPTRFLAHLKMADRHGRILIDWLRNGMSATAVSSFCPRARTGATVATPLAWDEVKDSLDPSAFTVRTVPERLQRLRQYPWRGFAESAQRLPKLATQSPLAGARTERKTTASEHGGRKSAIVVTPTPKRRY